MIYIILFFVFASFGIYNLTAQFKQLKEVAIFLYCFSFAVLAIFAGLRYHTGADWPNYEFHFNNILADFTSFFDGDYRYNDPVKFEMGYVYFTSFIKFLGLGITSVFFLAVILNLAGAFMLIKKFSPYPFVALLSFFSYGYIQFNFAGVRQAMAFFFFAIAIKYLIQRRFWMYALCIIAGYFFHSSIVALILLYFVPVDKFFKPKVIIGAVLLALFINFLFPITEVIPKLSAMGYLPEYMNNKLLGYLQRDDYGTARGLGIGFFLKLSIFLVCIRYRNTLQEKFSHFNVIFNIFCLYFIIWLLTNSFEVLVSRYSMYFQIFQDIILSYMLLLIPAKQFQRLAFFSIFLVGINFYFFFGIFKKGIAEEYHPYQNYLFSEWPKEYE